MIFVGGCVSGYKEARDLVRFGVFFWLFLLFWLDRLFLSVIIILLLRILFEF